MSKMHRYKMQTTYSNKCSYIAHHTAYIMHGTMHPLNMTDSCNLFGHHKGGGYPFVDFFSLMHFF